MNYEFTETPAGINCYAKDKHCPLLDKPCMGTGCVKWEQLLGPKENTFGRCTVVMYKVVFKMKIYRTIKHLIGCAKALNRRVSIETILLDMSQGRRPLPDKEECRILALKLGTPKEEWSQLLKDHK